MPFPFAVTEYVDSMSPLPSSQDAVPRGARMALIAFSVALSDGMLTTGAVTSMVHLPVGTFMIST